MKFSRFFALTNTSCLLFPINLFCYMITEGSLLVVLIVNTPKYVKFLTFSVFAFRKTAWRYSN